MASSQVEDIIRRATGKDCKICAQFSGLTAKELFSWTRPAATGIVVSIIAALLLIFSYFEYTIVLFACRLLQVGFAVLGGLVYSKQYTISAEDVRDGVSVFADNFKPILVNTCDGIFRLLAWEQPGYSAPLLIGSVVLAFLSTYLEDAFLILVVTILAFGGTPLYNKYHAQIDPHVEKLGKQTKKLISQIPIGKSKND